MPFAMRIFVFYSFLISLISSVAPLSVPHSLNQRWDPYKRGIIWAAAPQLVEPGNLPPTPFNSTIIFQNSTIRQTVKVYHSTTQLRLHLSNTFGVVPLSVDSIAIASPFNKTAGGGAIIAKTATKVTFDGNDFVTIPNGALAISDPITFKVRAKDIVAITMYLSAGQSGGAITGHPGSRTTSWMTFGDQVSAGNLSGSSLTSIPHWYFISGLEGQVPQQSKTLSIIGDSITDGRASTTNANNRWPDYLFNRLQSDRQTSLISIANQGLGGNAILTGGLGPNALARVERDIIAQPGIGYGMIFEGVNDIGTASPDPVAQKQLGDSLISAFKQFSTKLKGADLPVFAATITPFGKSFYGEASGEREKTRVRVNEWLRAAGRVGFYNAVIDFDKVLRDPKNASILAEQFDSGDGLHPNPVAFEAMAKAVPLDIFR